MFNGFKKGEQKKKERKKGGIEMLAGVKHLKCTAVAFINFPFSINKNK